jgi:hypothetical protein
MTRLQLHKLTGRSSDSGLGGLTLLTDRQLPIGQQHGAAATARQIRTGCELTDLTDLTDLTGSSSIPSQASPLGVSRLIKLGIP